MNLTKTAMLTLAVLVLAAGTTFAGANAKEGKEIFQDKCKICHAEGQEGGKVTPSSKTRSQWRRFFKKNQHTAKPESIDSLTEDELKSLRMFLDGSAADADKAETCG